MAEKSVSFLNQRVDQLLLGATLGALSLGYYSLAFSLVIFPVARINPILTRVAFPAFAKVQDDDARLRRGYMVVQHVVALVNFPILMGIAVLAPILVPLVLGPQWDPAVPLVQILAFVGMLRATGNPAGTLLLAKGRAKRAFHWNIGLAVIQIPVVGLGAYLGGGVGVALAVLLAQVVFFGANYVVNIRSTVGPCLREHLTSFLPAAICSALAGGIVVGLVQVVSGRTYADLALLMFAGAALYVSLLVLLFRRSSLDVIALARGR
jgi:O-antigen/teichoic acid export membrane protein